MSHKSLKNGQTHIGVIGLGVMGRGLAENFSRHGCNVAAFEPLRATGGGANEDCQTLMELVERLPSPRVILLMVTAGEPVDRLLEALEPLLAEGDLVIDGGNSHFRDSMRRAESLKKQGLSFMDAGISGGAAGARDGVSLMAGGTEDAFKRAEPLFKNIAAKGDGEGDGEADGALCYGHMGPAGAGHFVKMVHNGIEYALMQAISEAAYLLERLGGLSHAEMGGLFSTWSRGDLSSYLVEITAKILKTLDTETNRPLLEVIGDKADQKGTGQWAAAAALDLGVPAPTIAEAVFARSLSARERQPSERSAAPKDLPPEDVEKALLAAMNASFDQGFQILDAAARAYDWPFEREKIAGVWRGGCIVRAKLLVGPPFTEAMTACEPGLRRTVAAAVGAACPVPALSSVLAYWDAYGSGRLWTNMIQAQRDYFGAHGYRRVDKDGVFHTDWRK